MARCTRRRHAHLAARITARVRPRRHLAAAVRPRARTVVAAAVPQAEGAVAPEKRTRSRGGQGSGVSTGVPARASAKAPRGQASELTRPSAGGSVGQKQRCRSSGATAAGQQQRGDRGGDRQGTGRGGTRRDVTHPWRLLHSRPVASSTLAPPCMSSSAAADGRRGRDPSATDSA